MTTDEMLRRFELTKMFVNSAIEVMEPVVAEWRIGSTTYDSDHVTNAGLSLKDLRKIKERLMKMLGSMNDDDSR